MNRNSFFFYRYRFFLDLGLKFLFRGLKKFSRIFRINGNVVLIDNNKDIVFKIIYDLELGFCIVLKFICELYFWFDFIYGKRCCSFVSCLIV